MYSILIFLAIIFFPTLLLLFYFFKKNQFKSQFSRLYALDFNVLSKKSGTKVVNNDLQSKDVNKPLSNIDGLHQIEKPTPKFSSSSYDIDPEKVVRICFTGGPCGGKTSAIFALSQILKQKYGYNVYIVEEAASLLNRGGVSLFNSKRTHDEVVQFQIDLLQLQINLEDTFTKMGCSSEQKTIILCDRGTMDGSSFMKDCEWQDLLKKTGYKTMDIRENRYELIIHLVTAAIGAEEYYTKSSNSSRHESLIESRIADTKAGFAWSGHINYNIIDNSIIGLDQKTQRCLSVIERFLCIPGSSQFKNKYLIKNPLSKDGLFSFPIDQKFEQYDLEETYLKCSRNYTESKICIRRQNNSLVYIHCFKYLEKGEIFQRKELVSLEKYLKLLDNKDSSKIVLMKKRASFTFLNFFYIIDCFLNIDGQPCLMSSVSDFKGVNPIAPDFINVIKNVNSEPSYLNISLASKSPVH